MLPEDIATEIRDRKHYLNTVDKVVHYITGELSRYRDKEICHLHDKRAEHLLDSAPKNPINSFMEAETKMQGMMEKLKSLVAAFSAGKKGKSPKGCGKGTGGGGDDGKGARLPKPDPNLFWVLALWQISSRG